LPGVANPPNVDGVLEQDIVSPAEAQEVIPLLPLNADDEDLQNHPDLCLPAVDQDVAVSENNAEINNASCDSDVSSSSEDSDDDSSSESSDESSSESESEESSSSDESDSSDEPEDEDGDFVFGNLKVYGGCNLSVDEAVYSLMDVFMSKKLKKTAIVKFLKVLLKFLPEDNIMPRSRHTLFKYVEDVCPPLPAKVHHYCSVCLFYVGCEEQGKLCPLCNSTCNKFYQLPLANQIQNLFENLNLAQIITSILKKELIDKLMVHILIFVMALSINEFSFLENTI